MSIDLASIDTVVVGVRRALDQERERNSYGRSLGTSRMTLTLSCTMKWSPNRDCEARFRY
jgi:hypothetical protein